MSLCARAGIARSSGLGNERCLDENKDAHQRKRQMDVNAHQRKRLQVSCTESSVRLHTHPEGLCVLPLVSGYCACSCMAVCQNPDKVFLVAGW